MSEEDIETGTRWGLELARQLETTKIAVVCVTPENMDSPWLNFEAGAVAKAVEKAFVCPYLFHLEKSDLRGPLAQFQAAKTNQEDTLALVYTINKALGRTGLDSAMLHKAFMRWWPDLYQALQRIAAESPADQEVTRSDHELITEVLERVRALGRKQDDRVASAAQELTTWLLWKLAFKPGEEIDVLKEAIGKGELPTDVFQLRPPLRALIRAVVDGKVPPDVLKIDQEVLQTAIEQGANIPGVAIKVYATDHARVLGEVYFNPKTDQWEIMDVADAKFRTSREAIDWLSKSE